MQLARINPSHPLARQALAFSIFAGSGLYNAVSGKVSAALPPGTGLPSVGRAGPSATMTNSGADGLLVLPRAEDLLALRDQATFALMLRKTDTTFRGGLAFGVNAIGQPVSYAHAYVPFSDGTVYFDFGGGSGDNRLTVASLSFSTSLPMVWVFSAGQRGMRIYKDGAIVASSNNPPTRTAQAFNMYAGSVPGLGGGNDLVELVAFGAFTRQWTDDEAFQWMRAPFALLAEDSLVELLPYSSAPPSGGGNASARNRGSRRTARR